MGPEDMARFADGELRQLRTDLDKLVGKFEDHVTRYNDYIEKDLERYHQLVEMNGALQHQLKDLTKATEGLVQLQNDIRTAARLGNGIGKFITWVIKIPLIGAGLLATYHFITTGRLPGG